MDPVIVSELQLSEDQVTRLLTLESDYITPDEAKAIAVEAIGVNTTLHAHCKWLEEHCFKHYSEYVDSYRLRFVWGIDHTYWAARIGSNYYGSFEEQVSDKWQEEPWEANKIYITDFLNDIRASHVEGLNNTIRKYFDELPMRMRKLKSQINNVKALENILPGLDAASEAIAKVDGFGKMWDKFSKDAELIRDKLEIAVDSRTKTYITERIKVLGKLSETLSEAMGVYENTLYNSGILKH